MLAGRLPERELRDAIVVATRRYAKRQETWFRHQLRGERGAGSGSIEVWTLDATEPPEALAARIAQHWRGRTAPRPPPPSVRSGRCASALRALRPTAAPAPSRPSWGSSSRVAGTRSTFSPTPAPSGRGATPSGGRFT